ncbi:MAG: trigger factor family protein, partial [Firmicutes bacterium]|nr:trigger factor family protein [Bacillota bacterium]
MKSTFISKEDNKVKFTMDFTAEEFEQAVVKVYQAKKGQFNIDGFRRGKAPRSIIERYYGEGVFFEDAVNELFQTAYPEALKELDLEVVDMPNAEFSEIGKGKPLTITINVPVYPVVEVKDYKGLAV